MDSKTMDQSAPTPEKHTPGPWHISPEPLSWAHVFATGKDGHSFVLANCKSSMTFVTSSDRATDEANARLIAAAPELLEAALHARTCVPYPSDAHAKLNAAIARATGAAS